MLIFPQFLRFSAVKGLKFTGYKQRALVQQTLCYSANICSHAHCITASQNGVYWSDNDLVTNTVNTMWTAREPCAAVYLHLALKQADAFKIVLVPDHVQSQTTACSLGTTIPLHSLQV